jgi:tRNA (cmo5U34)-methyltransferase
MQTQPQRLREDWFDDEYVHEWVRRQDGRAPKRLQQFALLRAMVPFEPGASFRYLDIGAGPGHLDELILARHTGAQATLLDGSTAMLDHARERLSAFGDRAAFVQGDLSTPDWAHSLNGPFSLAVSCIAIHNLRDPRRIRTLYREIYDVLDEGGLFVNLDYVRQPNPSLRSLAEWASADAESGLLGGGGGSNLPGTVDEQVIWLREAGFTPADCFWKEFRVALFGGFKGQPKVPALPPRQRG